MQESRRYFWPPLPDEPKVEWLAAYASDASFPKTAAEKFKDAVLGETDTIKFIKPWGVVSNGAGKVYITDTSRPGIVVFDFIEKKVRNFGEGETPMKAPVGIAIDASGNIYVSDSRLGKIYIYTKEEAPLSVISDEILNWPVGMVVDDSRGRLYVVNAHNHNIVVFDLSGKYLFSIGRAGDRPGYFNMPVDIDLDSQGNLVVADAMNARIQIFSPEGKFIRMFGHRGDGLTDFQLIKGVAVDQRTDYIYVTDGRANRVLIFDQKGEALLSVGGAGSGPGAFLLPQGLFIEKDGRMFIVDSMNNRFQEFQIIDDEWLKKNPIK